MSSKHSMPEMKEGGVNVTPLIDVVMCLIIFFMLVAKIGVSTGAKPMALPATLIGKKLDQIPDTIVLSVFDPNIQHDGKDKDGNEDVTGHAIPEDPNDPDSPPKRAERPPTDQPVVWASWDTTTGTGSGKAEKIAVRVDPIGGGPPSFPLRDQLRIALNARKEMAKKENNPDRLNNFSVTVRAEKDLPFSMLEKVLAAIAEVGIDNVNYGAGAPKNQTVQVQK